MVSMPALTIGIEEEYQIIDPKTRELRSYIQQFLEEGRVVLGEQVKPELWQSQVEVGSHICRNVKEVRQEVVRLRRTIKQLAAEHGLVIGAAGTHPFSSWESQEITSFDRYYGLVEQLQAVARRLLIFGLHVHIGIEDPELRIAVMNQARYFAPHILALSTSSPFWVGRDTGLKSYRSIVFEMLPRTGLPPSFSSAAHYENFVNTLIRTGCIEEATKIWWDIRPHAKFPTLEFRIADICTKVDEAVCIAALFQAIVAKLVKLRMENRSWRDYRHALIMENKWRAVRHGIDGKLIDFGKEEEVPMRFLARELLELVDDVVDELGSREEVNYVNTILREGTSADRQLTTYRRTGDIKAVVDQIVAETQEGWE
jgi:carboxylate-amine ligase